MGAGIFHKEWDEHVDDDAVAGEHTDYNEGFVLPMALPLVTVVVGRCHHHCSGHHLPYHPYHIMMMRVMIIA